MHTCMHMCTTFHISGGPWLECTLPQVFFLRKIVPDFCKPLTCGYVAAGVFSQKNGPHTLGWSEGRAKRGPELLVVIYDRNVRQTDVNLGEYPQFKLLVQPPSFSFDVHSKTQWQTGSTKEFDAQIAETCGLTCPSFLFFELDPIGSNIFSSH